MSIFRMFLALAALGTLVWLAGCGGGGNQPLVRVGQVDGHVYTTAQGALAVSRAAGVTPLAGATVAVHGTTVRATTDADGYFLLSGVPAGVQSVVITAPGYQGLSISVNVIADTKVTLTDGVLNPAPRKWTLLVYLNAANDLEEYGLQDVNEMEKVPNSDQVAVVVQMKRSSQQDTSDGNWKTTRRFPIIHDDDTSHMTSANAESMEDLGYGIDMGLPSTLSDFITWGKAHYPAEHYLLVIWNHGAGWYNPRSRAPMASRGVSFDDDTGSYITTGQLPGAITTLPPLDVVAFDASLMQMVEVDYEIRNTCDYIVGSEESPPGEGYAYDVWLGPLVQNPNMSPRDLAVTIARETLNFYGSNTDITQSVIDTSKLDALATALDTFAVDLKAYATPAMRVDLARDLAEHYKYYVNKDLYHYANLVADRVTASKVRASAAGVKAAINDAVIANYHGNSHLESHGLAIYIPSPTEYPRDAADYVRLLLSVRTHWDEWLQAQPLPPT